MLSVRHLTGMVRSGARLVYLSYISNTRDTSQAVSCMYNHVAATFHPKIYTDLPSLISSPYLLPDHVYYHATSLARLLLTNEPCCHRDRASIVLDPEPLDVGMGGDPLGLGRAGYFFNSHIDAENNRDASTRKTLIN